MQRKRENNLHHLRGNFAKVSSTYRPPSAGRELLQDELTYKVDWGAIKM